MYDRFAAVYDAIYKFKNYEEEVAKVAEIVRARNPEAKSLLDVGCGTGEHILHLKKEFDCVGIDLSPQLLAACREKNPDVQVFEGDMKNLDLQRKFDAVICLFGAVGYMLTAADLDKAIANMAKHFNRNGVLIVEPWLFSDRFTDGHYNIMTAETETMKIARSNTSRRVGDISEIDFHFLVASAEGTEHFQEVHRLGLYSKDVYQTAFDRGGLSVEFDESGFMGRGMFIAQRE
jgi:ubiquinone/menaquinone biosynthesis C-methylase UbiE